MNSVIVFLPPDVRMGDIEAQIEATTGIASAAKGAALALDGQHLYYRIDPKIDRHYEGHEFDQVLAMIDPWQALVLDYSDIELVKMVVSRLVQTWPSVVDDDHGRIQSGLAFAQRLAEDPGLDWRGMIEPDQ